jgi:short subunit dehydrogenase-like uncharacterized protein
MEPRHATLGHLMIAVYGATGYTGRLVAAELRRRGLAATLCGRSQERLEGVARGLDTDWPVRAAAIDDAPGLRQALLGASAVINCAGPFTFYGAPVIEAALDVGAHYCDTTGEQPYMEGVFRWLDEPARAAGRAVVPGVGFDYVPGDLACALAAEGLEPLESVDVAYAVGGFGATRGTMHSALEMLGGETLDYTGGQWGPAGRPPLGERVTFPEPLGEQVVARYPSGEIVTVPRHVDTRSVRAQITAKSFAPHPRLTSAVPAAAAFVVSPLLRTPLRGAFDAVIDRLPEGPAEDARRSSAFTIVADARGVDGTSARAIVEGRDVYGITAVIAVEIARRMTTDGFEASGALAPAQAVDPADFLAFLGEHGVSHRVERPATREPTART